VAAAPNSQIFLSSDGGKSWQPQAGEVPFTCYELAFDADIGVHVAEAWTPVDMLTSKDDGLTWIPDYGVVGEQESSPQALGDVFLCVGERNGNIQSSEDGVNWVQFDNGLSTAIYAITVINTEFYLLGSEGVFISADGDTFTKVADDQIYGLTQTESTWVGVQPGNNSFGVSKDLKTWEYFQGPAPANANRVRFVETIAYYKGTFVVSVSEENDGMPWGGYLSFSNTSDFSWTIIYDMTGLLRKIGGVAAGNGVFIFDQYVNSFSVSTDGYLWNAYNPNFQKTSFGQLIFAGQPDSGFFFYILDNLVYSSTDGMQWTEVSTLSLRNMTVQGVNWIEETANYVATTSTGSLYFSKDGMTFAFSTTLPSPQPNPFPVNAVVYNSDVYLAAVTYGEFWGYTFVGTLPKA